MFFACFLIVSIVLPLWFSLGFFNHMHTCHNIVQKQRQCIVGAQETHYFKGIFARTILTIRKHAKKHTTPYKFRSKTLDSIAKVDFTHFIWHSEPIL